jgi:hypothetical protein
MDYTRIGERSWSDPTVSKAPAGAVESFLGDADKGKVTNSVGDLLQMTRERTARKFLDPDQKFSASAGGTSKNANASKSKNPGTNKLGAIKSTQNQNKFQNVHERPPRRVEVSYLETEFR